MAVYAGFRMLSWRWTFIASVALEKVLRSFFRGLQVCTELCPPFRFVF